MTGLIRYAGLAVAILALGAAGPASAQENIQAGMTPAQLYASDCAICHKSPRGLTQKVGFLGLDSFLREHYTSSRESAAAITAYLQAIDREPPPAKVRTRRAGKGGHKNEHKAKLAPPANIPSGTKSSETKPSETKSSETKSSETKSSTSKPSAGDHEHVKAAGAKTGDTKSKTEAKTETKKKKSAGSKAEASKTNSDKPAKDDKSQKSD